MFIEREIAAALMPLVNNRAYPLVLPQRPDYPAIIWNRVDSKIASGDDYGRFFPVPVAGRKSLYQVVIFASRYADNASLLRKCVTVMEKIAGCYLEDMADGYDHDLKIYTTILNFIIWNELTRGISQETKKNPPELLLDTIAATLEKNLTVTVYARPVPAKSIKTESSVLLDIVDMDSGINRGDKRLSIKIMFKACCLARGKHAAGWLAVRLLETVKYNHWGKKDMVSHPENIESRREAEYSAGDLWVVMWRQTLFIDIAEPSTTKRPEQVFFEISDGKYGRII